MSKRIGILGGTFDPIHIGHLRAALEAAEWLALDEVLLIPSARPPHRDTPQVSAEQRLDMVRLAVANVPLLRVDDRELRRNRPSWTIETLESLRAEYGAEVSLFLLLGWDAFCGIATWHRWQELLMHCHIAVLQRPDFSAETVPAVRDFIAAHETPLNAITGSAGRLTFIPQAPLAVSATTIRRLLAAGRSVQFLVPDAVLHYLHTHGLYRAFSLNQE